MRLKFDERSTLILLAFDRSRFQTEKVHVFRNYSTNLRTGSLVADISQFLGKWCLCQHVEAAVYAMC